MVRNMTQIWIMIYFNWFFIIVITLIFDEHFVLIINIILYILKIDDYLEIMTAEEVKEFVAINFSECIMEEQNLIKGC